METKNNRPLGQTRMPYLNSDKLLARIPWSKFGRGDIGTYLGVLMKNNLRERVADHRPIRLEMVQVANNGYADDWEVHVYEAPYHES
jgi:hypothetical protein